jgi:two-component system response regulator FixJ
MKPDLLSSTPYQAHELEPPLIHLVDDDMSHLRSLSRLLRASGFQVRVHLSAAEFLACLPADGRGCVITDLMMPEMDGIALQQALLDTGNPLPVVFLSGHGDVPVTVRAMKNGAEDFLTKNAPKEDLIAAVNRALEHNRLDRLERGELREKRKIFEVLTEREMQTLRLVLQGLLNKQIAAELGIHERTVKLHRTNLTSKLGVHSVAELSRLVQEARLGW